MSVSQEFGSAGGPGAGWNLLVSRAVDPGSISGPLGAVIMLFGELGFSDHLADPGKARDQCISVSETFVSMCAHRSVSAAKVSGILVERVPPFKGEGVIAGHTAVRAPAGGQDDSGRELVIDWTARQFHSAAPVPLIVPLEDWRAFWQDIRDSPSRAAGRVPRRSSARPRAGRAPGP